MPATTSPASLDLTLDQLDDDALDRARWRSLRSRLTDPVADAGFWGPLAIRFAMMMLQTSVVAALRVPGYGPLLSRFKIWDAQWYATIIRHGYPATLTFGYSNHITFGYPTVLPHLTRWQRLAQLTFGTHQILLQGREYAFFPLYPAVGWVVSHLTGLSATDAGLVVSWLASCALGPLVYRVAKNQGASSRVAYLAVVLLGLLPMAVVFQMGYAEALFTALSLGAFICAQQRRWAGAGALLLLAGLTRPVGYVIAAGVLAMGLLVWRADPQRQRRELYAIGAAAAAGAASSPLVWAFTAIRIHRLTGWFYIQKQGWGTRFDFGRSSINFIVHQFRYPLWHASTAIPSAVFLVGGLVIVVTLVRRAIRNTTWIPFAVLGGLAWVTVAGSSNYWNSKPRLLLLCFILVVPAAFWLVRQKRWIVLTLLSSATVLNLWYGAYMITRWPHAI